MNHYFEIQKDCQLELKSKGKAITVPFCLQTDDEDSAIP
jgi:hypothetical protein